jgi:hypothetical protein
MHEMDARRKNQLLFYLDIVALGLGAVALVTLVHDAFQAGYASQVASAAVGDYLWRMVAEIGVVAVALVYFLTRFFRIRIRELSNPWG